MVRDKNSEREKKEGMENDEVGDSKYTVPTEYSVLTTMDGSGITLPVPWSSSLGILTVSLSLSTIYSVYSSLSAAQCGPICLHSSWVSLLSNRHYPFSDIL